MEEVILFFKIVAMKNKNGSLFDIDFLTEKVFNNPLSRAILQEHVFEMVLYFHF